MLKKRKKKLSKEKVFAILMWILVGVVFTALVRSCLFLLSDDPPILPTMTIPTTPTMTTAPVPTETPVLVLTETPMLVLTETPVVSTSACEQQSQYCGDITVEDWTVFEPGTKFIKTWCISNTGSCAWPDGTVLTFISGSQMNAPYSVVLPSCAAGESIEASVQMYAPSDPGDYTGNWAICDEEHCFGLFTVVISVADDLVPTVTQPAEATVVQPTSAVCDCSGNRYNCGDFSTHSQAQACFEYCKSLGYGDVHDLDRDEDNIACESLQ